MHIKDSNCFALRHLRSGRRKPGKALGAVHPGHLRRLVRGRWGRVRRPGLDSKRFEGCAGQPGPSTVIRTAASKRRTAQCNLEVPPSRFFCRAEVCSQQQVISLSSGEAKLAPRVVTKKDWIWRCKKTAASKKIVVLRWARTNSDFEALKVPIRRKGERQVWVSDESGVKP